MVRATLLEQAHRFPDCSDLPGLEGHKPHSEGRLPCAQWAMVFSMLWVYLEKAAEPILVNPYHGAMLPDNLIFKKKM